MHRQINDRSINIAESTRFLRKGKCQCTADLLFDWLVFSYFAFVALDIDFKVWSTVQWYISLQSKLVFSEFCLPDWSAFSTLPQLTLSTQKLSAYEVIIAHLMNVGHWRNFQGSHNQQFQLVSENSQWLQATYVPSVFMTTSWAHNLALNDYTKIYIFKIYFWQLLNSRIWTKIGRPVMSWD